MIKRSREQWEVLFSEQAVSGLSAQQFCRQRSLCAAYFSLRKKQLCGSAPPSLPLAPRFVRVQKAVLAPEPAAPGRVVLRHGRSELELQAISPEWLSRLLVALA